MSQSPANLHPGQSEGQPLPASFVREQLLIRLLMTFIATGLFFMLVPGTFLGVWNLFAISGKHSPGAISAAWIQAHGHAQLFGWIGTFILGIGFYSVPNLRKVAGYHFKEGWLIWAFWTLGVALHWFADVYLWNWKALLPLSGVLELAAVILFIDLSYRGQKIERTTKGKIEPWTIGVLAGTAGLLLAILFNTIESFIVARQEATPAFPAAPDGALLFLATWAFPVPIAWGLTARWMPPLLGIKPTRPRLFLSGIAADMLGVICGLVGHRTASALLIFCGTLLVPIGLRLFEPTIKEAKTAGVHPSFPFFMRLPYAWLIAAAALDVWAALIHDSLGIGGASRHAMTVGFIATLVFTVAPRMLPAFMGRKGLFSPGLMAASLFILSTGCAIRVPAEILGYRHYWASAWTALPVSASLEMLGITLFAINMIATIRQPPLMPQMDLRRSKK